MSYGKSLGSFGVFFEVFGDESSNNSNLNFDSGITYLIDNNKQLDLSIGRGLNNDMFYISAGFSPVGEKYLFSDYKTLINLGGFANITKMSTNNLIAYDICPVNIVFNHLSNLIQQKYDDKGKIAASGKLNLDLFRYLQSLEYYKLKSPKSLGVEWVNDIIFPILSEYSRLSVIDLLHTFSCVCNLIFTKWC